MSNGRRKVLPIDVEPLAVTQRGPLKTAKGWVDVPCSDDFLAWARHSLSKELVRRLERTKARYEEHVRNGVPTVF